MMTMLHSVWSGGGSAAGRRRSLLALGALLALIASALIWVAPTQAQNLNPPVAIASVSVIADDGSANANRGSLDASGSFDPGDQDAADGNKGINAFQWEVVTDSYTWLSLDSYDTAITYFNIPSADLAALYGQTIEFRVTVTDGDDPPASASEIVTFNINQRPTADIAVSAYLEDEDSDEEGTGRYTIDAVIDGPGENGNAANEWDIMESALLVLDGSGSSDPDPNGELGYEWDLIYPSITTNNDVGLQGAGTEEQLSTEDPDTDGVQTIENITADESPYYAYYTLTVADDDSVTSTSVVKLVIHDQPAAPEVREMSNLSAATDTYIPVTVAEGDPPVQAVLLPYPTPRYVVNPGVTVTVNAEVTDADDVEGEETTITGYEWSTGEAPDDDVGTDVDESKTQRIIEVPDDAEDDTIITVTLTATDDTGLTGEGSVEFLVIEGNTTPMTSLGFSPRTPANIQQQDLTPGEWYGGGEISYGYTGSDGLLGGDRDEDTVPTGRITIRGIAFDPDQPDNTLLLTWVQIDTAKRAPIDPNTYTAAPILDLEFPEPGVVSFEVPEIGIAGSTLTSTLNFSAIDKHGVGSYEIVSINFDRVNSAPLADAGDDQTVQSESFVRLNGARSSAVDKDESIETYSWKIINITTTPPTDEVPVFVQEQVFDVLIPEFINLDSGQFDAYNNFPIKGADTAYPSFIAPEVPDGIIDIQLTLELTITDEGGSDSTDKDQVTITVSNGFFSGYITGPNFCSNASLGGPKTYPFDSDGDGVTDVCSLRTTRRATVARRNALETLVALSSTIDVTDDESSPRTSSATFADLVTGRDGADADGTTPAVSTVVGTCEAPGLDELGDSETDLAADACSTGRVSDPPPPVDPTVAGEFFSGVITGPNFCTNLSLGGPRTYAFDSDDDGVADVCSLPYTRREAVARQNALEMFAAHSQYNSALAAACTALGSTDFGDGAADLAADECVVPPVEVELGDSLPTSTA